MNVNTLRNLVTKYYPAEMKRERKRRIHEVVREILSECKCSAKNGHWKESHYFNTGILTEDCLKEIVRRIEAKGIKVTGLQQTGYHEKTTKICTSWLEDVEPLKA